MKPFSLYEDQLRRERRTWYRAVTLWRYRQHRNEALNGHLQGAWPLKLVCFSLRVKWDETQQNVGVTDTAQTDAMQNNIIEDRLKHTGQNLRRDVTHKTTASVMSLVADLMKHAPPLE